MFVKNLIKPINLVRAEVLEKRTPKNHPNLNDLQQYIKILKSGYNGERQINYYLGQIPSDRFTFLPQEPPLISYLY